MPMLLVTRPEPDATDTASRLQALDVETLCAPMLEMKPLDTPLPDPAGLGAIALTSTNAIRALQKRGDLETYLSLPAFTVGDRTAAAAKEAGFDNVQSGAGTVDDLAALIVRAAPKGAILYPAAYHLSADLAGELGPHGLEVLTIRVYDMLAAQGLSDEVRDRLAEEGIDAAVFYSRRTAETFCHLVSVAGLAEKVRRTVTALCLSENIAEVLIEAGYARVALADYPSTEAMEALVLSFARGQIGP